MRVLSMRLLLAGALLTLLAVAASARQLPADAPAWAYGIAPADAPPVEEPHLTGLLRVPGSSREFTLAQIEDQFGPADWFPEDHPVMPDVVARGRRPDVRACGSCHMPNGKGRPSNGSVMDLPVRYFLQAIDDFKNGLRTSADPRKTNLGLMIAIAKAITPEEARAAAEYFGSMKWTPWIRVVETEMVPKTRIAGFIHYTLPGGGTEPLGMRIVETPENVEQTEPLRNPRSGFVAYAPVGSIKKGEALVATGGGRTVACGICHGADLRGQGDVPGIAGRSPSFLVRQMYDMQAGTRRGPGAAVMKPVVANLTNEDYVAIAAYLSSR